MIVAKERGILYKTVLYYLRFRITINLEFEYFIIMKHHNKTFSYQIYHGKHHQNSDLHHLVVFGN